MATLIPTASSCHNLQLPPTEKDDRLNLNVRTGSASTLYNSFVFTYGGLTIGLELGEDINIAELAAIYFLRLLNSKSKKLSRYLSGELFYLNLIERQWNRVDINANSPKPRPRLFHEVCAINNRLYVFGGLVIPDDCAANDAYWESVSDPADYAKCLVPANDLWEFDLATSKWSLLHDGSGYEKNFMIPKPRFNYKMTVINSLTCVNRRDHFGIFIAGGKDSSSSPIYENALFDLVERKYVGGNPLYLSVTSGNTVKDEKSGLLNIQNTDDNYHLAVDYCNSIIVNFVDEVDHSKKLIDDKASDNVSSSLAVPVAPRHGSTASDSAARSTSEESIIVYCPTKQAAQDETKNPLLSFKMGKSIKHAKVLPIHRKKKSYTNIQSKVFAHTIPFNLRYPTGGLFGQNIVLTGFLPNDFDISIFIYNKPTGKWSRLNIFCNHDYGSHRFWGGFAWQSHHKVVLIGNYITSRTTSSIRYFTSMITVSLPITNILASSELAGDFYHNHLKRLQSTASSDDDDLTSGSSLHDKTTDEEDTLSSSLGFLSDEEDSPSRQLAMKKSPRRASSVSKGNGSNEKINNSISFSEYVDYAAPKTNFTKIRSVFPPAAITLGRNAFDRFGDLISDFEFVSSDGDRIPVSLIILMERWGRFFTDLLAKGYVKAVDKFENDQSLITDGIDHKYSKSSGSGSTSSTTSYLFKIQNQFSLTNSSKMKNSVSTTGSFSSDSTSHDPALSKTITHGSAEKPTYHMTIPLASKNHSKEAPQFRLPFQDPVSASESPKIALSPNKDLSPAPGNDVDPHATSRINPSDSAQSSSKEPVSAIRKDSVSSFSSSNSLLNSHLQDLPPQLPLPSEPIPAVPATPVSFRSSSRKNSLDLSSPRASLIHTLTALRNIPTNRSPKESPFASPRTSMSAQGQSTQNSTSTIVGPQDLSSSPMPNLRPNLTLSGSGSPTHPIKPLESSPNNSNDAISSSSSDNYLENSLASIDRRIESGNPIPSNKKVSSYSSMTSIDSSPGLVEGDKSLALSSFSKSQSNSSDEKVNEQSKWGQGDESHQPEDGNTRLFKNALLNFDNIESGGFKMEPSLIPRKLYMPFPTSTLKAFAEYLYTGQVGNKWTLTPAALDNLSIAKFFRVPLLYDLISEVLFGIIGRKEAHVIKSGNKLKRKYFKLMKATGTPIDPNFQFPLDEYEGFMDTVDDGYLDLVLLKKSSNIHKNSAVSTSGASIVKRKKKSVTSNLSSIPGGDSDSRRPSVNDTEITEDDELSIHDTVKEDPEQAPEKVEKNDGDDAKLPNDSTDDSSDRKITSNSEEDYEFELGYLDSHDRSVPGIGPRSKSIFDRNRNPHFNSIFDADEEDNDHQEDKDEDDFQTQKEKILTVTLESLVSPTAPPPSDLTIDLIYEAAALTTDMKLMLRAANARQMSRILTECKVEFEKSIEQLTSKLEEQESSNTAPKPPAVQKTGSNQTIKQSSLENVPTNTINQEETIKPHSKFDLESIYSVTDSVHDKDDAKSIRSTVSRTHDPNVSSSLVSREGNAEHSSELKPSQSASSLSTMNTLRAMEKSKSSSFRSIGSFTPFKTAKSETRDAEKRINKVLKKDEKTRLKNLKEDEHRKQHEDKQMKKLKEKEQRLQAKASRNPNATGLLSSISSNTQIPRPSLSRSSSRVDTSSFLDLSARVSPDPSLISFSDRSSMMSRSTSSAQPQPQTQQQAHHHHHHHHAHNFFRHLGQKKKLKDKVETQLPQPLQQEGVGEEVYPDKELARTQTSLSVNSISSGNTVSTKKKHGLFGIKKSSPGP